MISQAYLDLLHKTENSTPVAYQETTGTDILLIELQSLWAEFEYTYSANLGAALDSLQGLASVGFLLQSRLTGTPLYAVYDYAKDLHTRKNAGYSGDSPDPWKNFRGCVPFGISAVDGCITRLCDKYTRFQNIISNPELDQVGEKAAETITDFAAYCLILSCLLNEG